MRPGDPPILPQDLAPSWSPDGQWIAFVHVNPDLTDSLDPNGLYITDAAGISKRLVFTGFPRSVDWSPDGRWLAFNDGALHLITAQGESLRTICTGGSFPSWSPDGKRIAFSTIDKAWLISPDGSGLTGIDLPVNGGIDPDWSSDGTRLVALLWPSGTTGEELYSFKPDGSDLRRLTNDNHEDRSPTWSPQGDLIAWNAWPRDARGLIRFEVWVMDTLGGSQRKIINSIAAPSWNPDGQSLVFSLQTSGAIRLFVINVDGTGLRQLTGQ